MARGLGPHGPQEAAFRAATSPEMDTRAADWPGWVPEAARNYLAHTEGGQSLRALAREAQVHPSTILRRIRRMEGARDDPLVDAALRGVGEGAERDALGGDEEALAREAAPTLRRLLEPGTMLAVARDMEMGVVVRDGPEGEPQRLAVVERRLAEALALRDWIAAGAPDARVARYRITAAGRAALRRLAAASGGMAEAPAVFVAPRPDETDDARLRHMRSLLPESPLLALSRRRDGQGGPFLPRHLVGAGERLREDFDMAAKGDDGAPDLAALLAGRWEGGAGKSREARGRVARALAALGPGLADVALACVCRLEGLESLERRMGWSARSGKVVLRIALERLRLHYGEGERDRIG